MTAAPEPRHLTLAHLPTPLERAGRFSEEIAGREIWIKRDDCTGLAFGGNKARKLEYLMAAAIEADADVVIAFGGVQSNHTRMTAAAARRLGIDCSLVLAGSPPEDVDGNLMLNRILGATLTFLSLTPQELTPEAVARALNAERDRLAAKGRRPFVLGPGGSTPLGILGYRRAFDEILQDARRAGLRPDRLIVAYGTGGTLAGLVLGNILAGRPLRITGVSVAPAGMPESLGVPSVRALVTGGAALLGADVDVSDDDIAIDFDHSGRAYAAATTEGLEAIRALVRTEGIFLDPVYTGKAMAGLIAMCRNGSIGPDERTIFLHTGGTPALFAYRKALSP